MKAVISSFVNLTGSESEEKRSIFHQMPPSSLRDLDGRGLSPDYAALLVCDGLIVDSESYDRLTSDRHWSYNRVAHVFKALYEEGFIQLEPFAERLKGADTIVAERVAHDMASHDWNAELCESLEMWSSFVSSLANQMEAIQRNYVHWERRDDAYDLSYLMHALHNKAGGEAAALGYAKMRDKEGSWVTEVLPSYLTYVHINIELSRRFHAPIHDWSDYLPFYRRLTAGDQSRMSQAATQMDKLFSVTFPEFEPATASHFVRILKDKRVTELRAMVDSAVRGDIVFDRDFAVATLRQALAAERKLARFRNITSYATLPLSYVHPLLGTPLAKITEHVTDAIHDRAKNPALDWFYLISDAAEQESSGA
jgi:hypothetical protein